MNDNRKRTIAIISSALALGGIGTGLALGATTTTPTPTVAVPAVVTPTPAPAIAASPKVDVPTAGDKVDGTGKDMPTAGDKTDVTGKDVATPGDKTDVAGDREVADKAGQEGIENPAAEAASSREVGEGTAADTGHADPAGQVDNQDQGVR